MRLRRKGHSEHDFLKDVRVVLIAVVSWFLLTTGGELIGNQANNTAFGQTIGHYVLLAAAVLVPVALAVWLVLYLRERRNEAPEPDEEAETAGPRVPSMRRRRDAYGSGADRSTGGARPNACRAGW